MKTTARSFIFVLAPFCVLLFLLIYLLYGLPNIPENRSRDIKFPRSLNELKLLGSTLLEYKNDCYWRILFSITVIYIFLQSFMIPGSVFFSVLLGYLYPKYLALLVIAFCSAVGASCCYIITRLIGSQTILKYFPDHVASCKKLMCRFKNMMFVTMFFLRLSPIVPNWLVNMCSPFFGVPIADFFLGTFFGVIPLSCLFVNAGTMLQELTDIGVTSVASVYSLAFFTVVSFLPFVFQSRIKQFLSE